MSSAPLSPSKEPRYLFSIGETGTGKTTMINSFANYSRYATLDEAIEKGPVVLADVGFNYSAAGRKAKKVTVFGSVSSREQATVSGITSTKGCSVYTIGSADPTSEDLIFYDSPGFGSQSSTELDVDKRAVHALCVVLKPDETRLHVDLRSFLEKEGKSFAKNIIYCFNNTRAHNFLPAATLDTLRNFLLVLEETLGVELPTTKENVFCFENDCFRYLCYLSTNSSEDKSRHHKVFSTEWNKNVTEFSRLVNYVKTLTPILHNELDEPDLSNHSGSDVESTDSAPSDGDHDSESEFSKDFEQQAHPLEDVSLQLEDFPIFEGRKLCREYLKAQKQAEKQKKEAIRFLNSFEEDEEKINVLILGETGVGKSTFVNGLANYLKFANLHEAKASGPKILISTKFTQWSDGKEYTIYYPAPGDDNRNENLNAGQSATQDPKFYKFYGENLQGKYREINVLDTPGIGDVKGIEKDGENFEKIFSCLADWGELHAILILLKPNQSRLTESMTYCLGELFGRLNKNCAPNVIFCCTNIRSYQYTPGDTYGTLGALLDEIRTKWDIEIPCHRQQVFSFDNESFRFLCASKQIEFDDKKTNNYNQSWMNSVSEMFRLFTRINNLTPCKTNDSLMVFNVRTAINTLLHPLEEDQKKIRALEMVIDENEVKKFRLNSELMNLLPKKHFNRINSVRKPRQNNRIDMVCTHCGEFDKHNPTEKHFKICHLDCKCSETSAARLNTTSEVLVQKCQCFDQETFVCKECRCPYQTHMKTEKELVQETVRELYKSVNQQIISNVKELKAVERIVDEKMKEKSDLESHVRFLENGINQLGAHLKNSCLLPYNEYVDGYAKKEIEDLRRQGSDDNAGRDKKVAKLQKLQAEYEHLVRIVDQKGTDKPEKTFESIISRIRQGASRSLRDRLTNIASFSARSDPFNRTTAVDIGKGWMGKLRADLY